MIVKRFQAATINEAMRKVKETWGHSAVILNTRRVKKGGLLGFLGKEYVEITAAMDEEVSSVNDKTKSAMVRSESISSTSKSPPSPYTTGAYETVATSSAQSTNEVRQLRQEIRKTQELVHNVIKLIDSKQQPATKNFTHIRTLLSHKGLDDIIIDKLLEGMPDFQDEDNNKWSWLSERLSSTIDPYVQTAHQGRVIALVGPTGAGKTTTLAKLAARDVLTEKHDAAFITFDTYRISAVEQLKTYGEILGIPVEVVCSPQEIKQAVSKFSKHHRVFIDTVGRSHHNVMQLSELRNFMDAAQPDEIHLTMGVTTDKDVMQDILEAYQDINITHFLFTKLDESLRFGAIVNLVLKYQLPILYLTNGQNVPDDIVAASSTFIANLILGDTDD